MVKYINNLFFLFLIIGFLFIPIRSEAVTITIYGHGGIQIVPPKVCPDSGGKCVEIVFSASNGNEIVIQDANTGQKYLVILEEPLPADATEVQGADLKIKIIEPLEE